MAVRFVGVAAAEAPFLHRSLVPSYPCPLTESGPVYAPSSDGLAL